MARKPTKSKAVAVPETPSTDLPDYLRGKEKAASFGNVDRSDILLPRVKLMQAISPELETYDNAKAGEFWHTVANESFGPEMAIVPIKLRKIYVLWAPRGDDRGVLARASDGVHWDTPDLDFEVKLKGVRNPVTYSLGETVADSGLAEFGSSNPADPDSRPAATLTYEFLFLSAEQPDLGPFIVYNTRSSVKAGKDLISKIELRPVDHYAQCYLMRAVKDRNSDGEEFYNYQFIANGYVDEALYERAKEIFGVFEEADYRAEDDAEEETAAQGATSSDKF